MITGSRSFRWLAMGLALAALCLTCVNVGTAWAEEPQATPAAAPSPTLDRGDNAWILVSSALVLMMTGPGLALSTAVWSARRTCWA